MLARYMLSSRVHPSVCHKPVLYLDDWTNRAVFGMGFASTYSSLWYKKTWVSPKIWTLPSGTYPNSKIQTPDSENFATTSRLRCQQNSSSSSTVELVDDTYTTIDESWLFTTSRSTVTFWLHHCDFLWICCTTCFYGWQDFDWQRASRGPSVVAEFVVFI